MRATRSLQWALSSIVLAVTNLCALGENTDFGQPLVQAQFDRLIPTSYPTYHPSFTRLQPTTRPLIHPGIPTVHITENLTQAFAKPLLITGQRPRPFLPPEVYRVSLTRGKPLDSGSLITIPVRPGSSVPARANTGTSKVDNQQR